jgi:hypothetical protein
MDFVGYIPWAALDCAYRLRYLDSNRDLDHAIALAGEEIVRLFDVI